jgi:hypothetical protein
LLNSIINGELDAAAAFQEAESIIETARNTLDDRIPLPSGDGLDDEGLGDDDVP